MLEKVSSHIDQTLLNTFVFHPLHASPLVIRGISIFSQQFQLETPEAFCVKWKNLFPFIQNCSLISRTKNLCDGATRLFRAKEMVTCIPTDSNCKSGVSTKVTHLFWKISVQAAYTIWYAFQPTELKIQAALHLISPYNVWYEKLQRK